MIISKEREKAFDKFQQWCMMKTLNKLNAAEMSLSIIKAVCDKPMANFILSGEKLKMFPSRSGIRQGYSFSPLLFSVIL